ncbi:phage baseplate assembly protein [Candidatus Vondammii sp. HM_W22]|uniref:phage baseplate assembly protein n=1 Tax=Candidatus Vondammii sp. HM_W22 TaxID=2687299 RepID=UPI00403DC55B
MTGWRHKDGLWSPNTRVRVLDEWMGFNDEWLMIGTVEFVLDARGQRTRLTVMPPEAYDLVPLPAEDGGDW